jgi:hypothetical protein
MLEEETVELGQESMTSDLRKIHEAGKHLLSLIDDILDLSKVEAGKLDVTIEPVDLDRLLDEITELAHPLIEERANRLVLDCPEPLGTLESDTRKIRQTLLNLIGNAAKFTEAGTITLGGRRFDDAGRLEITVTDTGIGMTQEQLDRLFQAFTQADQAISVKYGGTGLGLALSRRLARMLGGDLMASSEYGVGSTFTLRLPLDRAELPETPAGDA